MRILFDQGVPIPLRHYLRAHEVETAYERGWSTLGNGELLRRAESQFDGLVTTDRNIRHQQNLSQFNIAVLVLPTANWPRLQANVDLIVEAIDSLKPAEYRELTLP